MDPLLKKKEQSIILIAWFVRLRWVACVVALILVIITTGVFDFLDDSTVPPLIGLIAALAGTNLAYTILLRKKLYLNTLPGIQIVTDLLLLTLMLHFSGGIENPLSFVYIFHVILSGILLDKKSCYGVVVIAFSLYSLLAFCELSGVVGHYTLRIFPHEQLETHETAGGTPHHEEAAGENTNRGDLANLHASRHPVYVWSLTTLELFILLLTAYFITNIMDRLRGEERRSLEERQRLEHVLQATRAGLLILNKRLQPVWHNEPIETWLSVVETEPSDHRLRLPTWMTGEESAAAKTLRDSRTRSIEKEHVNANGQKQFFQVTVAPLVDSNGEVYEVVELVQDITNKKILEAEMVHTAKMITLGTMAAGIAHEVGNPLASISTRLHLMQMETDKSFIDRSIELLQKEIGRIERIVRGISQFGRSSPESWGPCPVNQIIMETVEMLKFHRGSKMCQITLQIDEGLPETLGVRDQLKQIFLNLGLNALEAMPRGGVLHIISRAERGDIKIEFADEGEGIPQKDMEKIFQPFFTTKTTGSGLGLFMVNHFVQAHGGRIEIHSLVGTGTRVVVSLPLHRAFKSSHPTEGHKFDVS